MTVVSTDRRRQESQLLEAARGGDERAFRRIVERRTQRPPHLAVRSGHERLQRRDRTPIEARVADRLRPGRRADHDPGEPLVESVWIEPYPDEALEVPAGYAAPDARYEQREALELAFVAALQYLPGTQRAVLILREVLGFSAREVADLLETTVPSVNSALQRARKTVAERLPARSQQATLRSVGDRRIRELVTAYVDAWAKGDVDAVRALLAKDAVFSMPPWAGWWRGGDTIAGFAKEAVEFCAVSLAVHITANAQPAVAYYQLNPDTGMYRPSALDVLTFDGTSITEITAFVTLETFARFGLPEELACAVMTHDPP